MAASTVIDLTSSQATQSRLPSSSHRLPTVSASQALQDLQNNESAFVQSGLKSLDDTLSAGNGAKGGFERGKISELWGPSGAGKTALALQATVNTLIGGGGALWLDACTGLHSERVKSCLSSAASACSVDTFEERGSPLTHLTAPTLSHLLGLILHPPADLLGSHTELIVIDGLNTLLDLDYPRYQFTTSSKTEQQKWQAGRRYAVLGSLVSSLSKLAVFNNLAVIVTTGCSTRMRPQSGLGAALAPGLGGAEWDSGIYNRLVVFRDFGGRFVGVQKCRGRSLISKEEVGEFGRFFGFDIIAEGLLRERSEPKRQFAVPGLQAKKAISPVKPRKRVFDEIADSDGEDVDEYGWADTDDMTAAEKFAEDQQQSTTVTETE